MDLREKEWIDLNRFESKFCVVFFKVFRGDSE